MSSSLDAIDFFKFLFVVLGRGELGAGGGDSLLLLLPPPCLGLAVCYIHTYIHTYSLCCGAMAISPRKFFFLHMIVS